jgi:ATP-dependent Clp protease ATP-binding subunit ClpC
MWEPFTQRAQRSIVLAQEEAQRLGNHEIGTEHILLGIIAEGGSIAVEVLKSLGVDLATARREVEANVVRDDKTVPKEMVFTPRAKRVIELAFEEARQLSHNYIGTETILLGIIREADGLGARVLENLGVDADEVRSKAVALLKADEGPSAPKSGD